MHPWDLPDQPRQWIHLDYTGLLMIKMFSLQLMHIPNEWKLRYWTHMRSREPFPSGVAFIYHWKSFWEALSAFHSRGRNAWYVTTTQATIWWSMLAQFGLPIVIITDNGTCFTSSEFAEGNKIHHVWISPYHPSSNSMAESCPNLEVQTPPRCSHYQHTSHVHINPNNGISHMVIKCVDPIPVEQLGFHCWELQTENHE